MRKNTKEKGECREAHKQYEEATTIGADFSMGLNSKIEMVVQIGDRVTIGKNVTVKAKTVIPDDTIIPDGATWE